MIGKRAIAVTLLLFFGFSAFIYPMASQWFTQKAQSEVNAKLADSYNETSPNIREQLREEAQQYNQELANRTIHRGGERYRNLMNLEGTDVIARLRVPKIDLDQPIRHTFSEHALLNGVGHADGSSMPIGGESTHAVLGGHRGLAEAIGFTDLPKLEIGDMVYVESLGETLTYQVIETKVLEPLEAAVHPIEDGRDLITLLTCTPLGVNSHRFVATAERVIPGDDTPAGLPSEEPGFPMWAVWAGSALLVSITAGGFTQYRDNRYNQARASQKNQESDNSQRL